MKFEFYLQMFADTNVPANLVKKVWAAQLWKEAQRDNFFAKFTGILLPILSFKRLLNCLKRRATKSLFR